ncbi:MAG: hypothetical protein QOJ06_1810 [Pseudonocardiales bacterium]|jgi:hypothetical protein|nr:hypothetical protein [Pseudonocardiales bacterium]
MTLISSGVNTRSVRQHTEARRPPRWVTQQVKSVEPEHLNTTLPELDQTEDPRGGAAAWALLVMAAALIAGILLALKAVGAF